VVLKNTSGVFNSTALERHLRHMGVETLLVTGVVTNMCVEGAARTAAEFGFDVFIVDDACAAWSPEVHAATLRSFRTLFGWVIDTDEAMARIEEGT
jgi:nicotinamidase-related amidase